MGARAFIALSLADPLVELLSNCADDIRAGDRAREIRWVSPGNYHLTLEFLGDVERHLLPSLAHALERSLHGLSMPEQQVDEVSYFPFVARPRVVAALLRPSPSLSELRTRVLRGVRAAGLGAPRRRFHPHITLGRVRAKRAPRLQIQPLSLGVGAELSTVSLFESRLRPEGASYTPLYQAELPISQAPAMGDC